jgi:hypothetical protein
MRTVGALCWDSVDPSYIEDAALLLLPLRCRIVNFPNFGNSRLRTLTFCPTEAICHIEPQLVLSLQDVFPETATYKGMEITYSGCALLFFLFLFLTCLSCPDL